MPIGSAAIDGSNKHRFQVRVMGTHLSIFHLLLVPGAAGCVFVAMKEAAGRSMPPKQLFAPPAMAGLTALLLLLMAASEPMMLRIWLGTLVVGSIVGAIRGATMEMRVDQVRSRIRFPRGTHTLWICVAIALAVAYEIAIALWREVLSPSRAAPSTAASLCAGMLTGRAVALVLRIPHAPNEEPPRW